MPKFSSRSCACTWREQGLLKDWSGKWSVALILTFLTGLVLNQSSSLSEGVIVTQSCLTLCDPMDSSLPGSSVHGILQASVLEWVTISFFKFTEELVKGASNMYPNFPNSHNPSEHSGGNEYPIGSSLHLHWPIILITNLWRRHGGIQGWWPFWINVIQLRNLI